MNYKIKEMPKVALGTWEIKDPKIISEVIPTALNAGYKHIDTAQIYFNEEYIGDALSQTDIDRSEYWITTKIIPVNFRYHAYDSIVESLKRLKTSYIDTILLHMSINDEDNLIAYKAAMKARDEGIVRTIGVSNFSIDSIEYIFKNVGEYPKYNQIIASVIQRVFKLEKYCKDHDITLMGYSSIRPYYNPNIYYNSDKENSASLSNDEKTIIDDLAKKYNTSPANILQKYVLDSGYVILPKSSNPQRVVDNFKVLDFELSSDDYNVLKDMCRYDDSDWVKTMEIFSSSRNFPDEVFKAGARLGKTSDMNFLNFMNSQKNK